MSFNMLRLEHLFELVNFIFVCACAVYFYKKYGAPLVKKAMQEKKTAVRQYKEQLSEVQRQAAQLEQDIADQETKAQYLLHNIQVWSGHEHQKKRRAQVACADLQEKFSKYVVAQEKAIALAEVTRAVMPEALHQVRQELSHHFSREQEQRRVLNNICKQLVRVGRHG